MFANLSGWHFLLILAVVLLLFGAARLPALSKSLGQSVRILRSEVNSSPANATKAKETTEATAPDAPTSTVDKDG